MSIAALIRAMAEAGATPEAIAIAVEALEAAEAKDAARRAKRAEQKRRERDSRATVAATSHDTPPSDKEAPHTPKEITSPHSPPKGGSYTPRAALETVLDAERTEAVVAHRQRIRKPLTAHAAKLLAGKFARCRDPNAAADAMVANGWQGFEPEWLENRPSAPRQTAPPRPQTHGSMWANEAKSMGLTDDEPAYEPTRYDLAGQAPGHDRGPRTIELSALPAGRRGH